MIKTCHLYLLMGKKKNQADHLPYLQKQIQPTYLFTMTCKILCHNWSFSTVYHILKFKYILLIKGKVWDWRRPKQVFLNCILLWNSIKYIKRNGKLKFDKFSSKLCKLGIPVVGCWKRTMKVLQCYWRLFLLTEGSERSIIT